MNQLTPSRVGDGIFSSDGKSWEHARALLRPQFTRTQISDLEHEETHVQHFIQALPPGPDGWTDLVDLSPMFFRLTMDSATEFFFGESANTQVAELHGTGERHAEFARLFDQCQDDLFKAFKYRDFWWIGITKQVRENCKRAQEYVESYVQKALARGAKASEDRYVFLEQLAKVTSNPVEIRDQLMSILAAGRDTTAGTLSFLFRILAQRPDVFSKLRETVIQDFGSTGTDSITFDTLKSCQYLQWCLSETLRLYPSVPGNARRSTTDTTLPRGGGPKGEDRIFVPKGSDVVYLVYDTHRIPELWGEDANDFRPERWEKRKTGFDFLPFNAGPR